MFKSIFSKNMVTFLVVLLVMVAVAAGTSYFMLNAYDSQTKLGMLTSLCRGVSSFIDADMENSEDFDAYLEKNRDNIVQALETMTVNTDSTVILVCSSSGVIELASGNDLEILKFTGGSSTKPGGSVKISMTFLEKVKNESLVRGNAKIEGLFNEDHYYCASRVVSAEGSFMGTVIAFLVSSDMDSNLVTVVRVVAIVSGAAAVIGMIIAFFVTRMIAAPLAKMSDAAEEFASGNFDVRIPVRGAAEFRNLASSFNAMADSMQRLEESRRMFLSNVSHDLRTPMTSIKGFIDNIISGAIPEGQVPHYLEVVSTEISRLSRLVSSLMNITKIEAGEKRFEMVSFDICEMARQIIISCEQRIEDKKLDVMFDAEEDNMYVIGDRDAIYQVMYNLCDNAIKFSREKGLYEIEIKTIERGSKISFSMYNEGQGISKEDLPYVFERFYKSDRSRGLDKTGVGLGLYISKTIIEQHGGSIKVESEEGKWCRFEFSLERDTEVETDRKVTIEAAPDSKKRRGRKRN